MLHAWSTCGIKLLQAVVEKLPHAWDGCRLQTAASSEAEAATLGVHQRMSTAVRLQVSHHMYHRLCAHTCAPLWQVIVWAVLTVLQTLPFWQTLKPFWPQGRACLVFW